MPRIRQCNLLGFEHDMGGGMALTNGFETLRNKRSMKTHIVQHMMNNRGCPREKMGRKKLTQGGFVYAVLHRYIQNQTTQTIFDGGCRRGPRRMNERTSPKQGLTRSQRQKTGTARGVDGIVFIEADVVTGRRSLTLFPESWIGAVAGLGFAMGTGDADKGPCILGRGAIGQLQQGLPAIVLVMTLGGLRHKGLVKSRRCTRRCRSRNMGSEVVIDMKPSLFGCKRMLGSAKNTGPVQAGPEAILPTVEGAETGTVSGEGARIPHEGSLSHTVLTNDTRRKGGRKGTVHPCSRTVTVHTPLGGGLDIVPNAPCQSLNVLGRSHTIKNDESIGLGKLQGYAQKKIKNKKGTIPSVSVASLSHANTEGTKTKQVKEPLVDLDFLGWEEDLGSLTRRLRTVCIDSEWNGEK